MAGFCKDCSQRLFTCDGEDFKGLTSPAENSKGVYAYVLCEGCGTNIFVDHNGARIDPTKAKDVE